MKGTIEFEWWENDRPFIKFDHKKVLDSHAIDEIHRMTMKGLTRGLLKKSIKNYNDSGEPMPGSSDYSGWWKLTSDIVA